MAIPIDGGGKTALRRVVDRLRIWRDTLYGWYDTSRTWVFPMSLVHNFIYYVFDGVWWVHHYADQFAQDYGPFTDFVNTLLETRNLDLAIQALWYDWKYLKGDPTSFVYNLLQGVADHFSDWIHDSGRWVLDRIYDVNPFAYKVLTDPGGALDHILSGIFSQWGQFKADPWLAVKMYLYEHDYPLYTFVRDPDNWVKLKVGQWLNLRPGFTVDFGGAMRQWIFDQIGALWDDNKDAIYKMGEKWLRYFWEGV